MADSFILARFCAQRGKDHVNQDVRPSLFRFQCSMCKCRGDDDTDNLQ